MKKRQGVTGMPGCLPLPMQGLPHCHRVRAGHTAGKAGSGGGKAGKKKEGKACPHATTGKAQGMGKGIRQWRHVSGHRQKAF